MLQALIFDFDGLMVDTESAIFQTWQEIYRDHNHELELSRYVQCVGSHGSDYDPGTELDSLVGRKLDWTTLLGWQHRRNHELLSEMDTRDGIRELLLEAESEGVPCAVASSSSSDWVLGWLERLKLRKSFAHVITRDLVARPKPAPDLFLLAMERLQVGNRHALVLEDSANGLKAAVSAEVPCVIVPNRVTKGLDFTHARAVVPTLAGLGLSALREMHTPGKFLAI